MTNRIDDWLEIGPPDSIAPCKADGCEIDSCAACASKIDPESHFVAWWGPGGMSICPACKRKLETT